MQIVEKKPAGRRSERRAMKVTIPQKLYLQYGEYDVEDTETRNVVVLGEATVQMDDGTTQTMEYGTIRIAGLRLEVVGTPEKGYRAITNLGRY